MRYAIKTGIAVAIAAMAGACGGEQTTSATKETAAQETAAQSGAAQSGAAQAGGTGISAESLARHIATLSDDSFEGRAPATAGGEKTRAYLIDEMKAIGLEPANGDSFEQETPLVEITADPAQSYLRINGEALAYGGDAVFWTKRVREEVAFEDSPMVFVGYGVVAPEYGWNDYEGLDVEGKTVVMLVNDPGYASEDPDLFNGRAMTYYGRWTYKFEEAARQGAAAAIIVHQTAPASYGWGVVEGSWSGAQLDLDRPDGGAGRVALEGWIQEDVARALFARAGLDFDETAAAAHAPGFAPVEMAGLAASGKLVNAIRRSASANVAGMLRGATHPDEYVLYMAHWDHLGVAAPSPDGGADEDLVSNGAVDNATGTGGILAIAEAFVRNETPPARSIVFMGVTAEESGLLGSGYFAEDPFIPLENIVGGVNIDGLQPTPPAKDIIVVGYGASELEDILKDAAEKRDLYLRPDMSPESGYFYRSDHISLAKKGVPMLYAGSGVDFVDGGEDAGLAFMEDYRAKRYHAPADEYSADWDLRAMTRTLNALYDVGAGLAYSDAWPTWYEGNEFRALRDAQRAGG